MIKLISYKTLFIITTVLDLDIHQMNVKTAFLYNDINEKIYVEQSHELSNGID